MLYFFFLFRHPVHALDKICCIFFALITKLCDAKLNFGFIPFFVSVHPLIRVSNQLVAAPITSDVHVQCYVEASPKAMNHWMRDNGKHFSPEPSLTDTGPYILYYPPQADTYISNYWLRCPKTVFQILSYITLKLNHVVSVT